jgi:hypothetical protein
MYTRTICPPILLLLPHERLRAGSNV